MTILSALQSAKLRVVGGRKATAFFTSQDETDRELVDLLGEVVADILDRHDWRALTKLAHIDADGVSTSLPLPADYERMIKATEVYSSAYPGLNFSRSNDLDSWYFQTEFSSFGAPGSWIVLDGALMINPAPADGTSVRFYYLSNAVAIDSNGATSSEFTSDDQRFILSERLLTLGLVWMWRAQKRLEYAQDFENYERALARDVADDKGTRVLTRTPGWGNVRVAFPGVLGPETY